MSRRGTCEWCEEETELVQSDDNESLCKRCLYLGHDLKEEQE